MEQEEIEENPKAVLKTKVFKCGNSYAILIPKALVDTEVLEDGQEVKAKIWGKTKGKAIMPRLCSVFSHLSIKDTIGLIGSNSVMEA